MNAVFYIAAMVAVAATILVITRSNPVHALLYLIVSMLSVALVFDLLGAPFAAALEVIIYAGAIMVLFVFVVMMLNLGPQSMAQENRWLQPHMWRGPSLLAAILLAELVYTALSGAKPTLTSTVIGPKAVGVRLFGPYLLGVELASLLLLAGLVGACHLGRRRFHPPPSREES
jgi:NADH-quinone oxidoreductase subunit J